MRVEGRIAVVACGTVLLAAGCAFDDSGGDRVVPQAQLGPHEIEDAPGVTHIDGPDSVGGAIGLGDIDGDGVDDFAVMRDDHNSGGDHPDGSVYLFYGGSQTLPTRAAIDTVADARLFTPVTMGEIQVDALGDIDGDGIDDTLVTSPDVARQALEGISAPLSTFLVLGRTQRWSGDASLRAGDEILEESTAFAKAGAAGDIDADGVEDLWMMRTAEEFVGPDDIQFLHGPSVGWQLPIDSASSGPAIVDDRVQLDVRDVRSLGDLDGDGADDLGLLTFDVDSVRVSIVYGEPGGWDADPRVGEPDAWIDGEGFIDIAGAGDLDGDGDADLVLHQAFTIDSDPHPWNIVWMLEGGPERRLGEIVIDWPAHGAGDILCITSFSILGDVDDDGRPDVAAVTCPLSGGDWSISPPLVIAPRWPEGSPTLRESDLTAGYGPPLETDWVGTADLGDVNGDGADDFGAVLRSRVEEPGSVHVVYGMPRH